MNRRLIVPAAFGLVVILMTVRCAFGEHNCEAKEKSLAALDLVEDSLEKAKNFYPDCEHENRTSSGCGKKDKSLGYIDIALNLVSEAKQSFPVCPALPEKEIVKEVIREDRSADCQEILASGQNQTGVYDVWPRNRLTDGRSVHVRCDMETAGGGWTVIQRRGNFSVQEDFFRDWEDYKNGFGNLSRDFWIGNDNIHALSNQGAYSLRLDVTDADGNSTYVEFRDFWIDDEFHNYTLHIANSTGTAGDDMTYSHGSKFSTKDRKNDEHTASCAVLRKSGFWFKSCAFCNPNGKYNPGVENVNSNAYYGSWERPVGLLAFEMKIKRL